MCLLSACQDVVICTSSRTFIMHVVPTQLCPHGERHCCAHIHMHIHSPLKILFLLSGTVLVLLWRSRGFHSNTTDGSCPFLLLFFYTITICKDHSIKLWPYKATDRLFGGSKREESNRFYFVCCHSASSAGAKARKD